MSHSTLCLSGPEHPEASSSLCCHWLCIYGLWAAYRTWFAVKRPLWLSWARLYRISSEWTHPWQDDNMRTVDDFRKDCLRELTKIKTAWPDLNYSTAQGVLILWPSKPSIPLTRHLQLAG